MARPRQASTVAAADSAPSVGAPFCWPMPSPAKPRIDLLRAGKRPSLAGPLPEAPYFIILSRAERRPIAEVWPLHLQEPLPILPVPLSMTPLGMISALIIRNAHRPRRSLHRTEPGWRHICGQRESEYSHARPYCHRLSFPLPPQRIG